MSNTLYQPVMAASRLHPLTRHYRKSSAMPEEQNPYSPLLEQLSILADKTAKSLNWIKKVMLSNSK